VWQSLSSPDFVAFYADFEGVGDLSPIRRVVGTLAARHYSSVLSAYTSMGLFTITFDRVFGKWEGAGTVTLSFDSRSRLFEAYYQGPVKQDVAKFVCEEFEVCRLVDAMVLRMHLTRLGPPDVAI
jgi:hypothetical protein